MSERVIAQEFSYSNAFALISILNLILLGTLAYFQKSRGLQAWTTALP